MKPLVIFLSTLFSILNASALEEKMTRNDEALQRLYEFHQTVEKQAYSITLKLCEIYQETPYIGDYMDHPPPPGESMAEGFKIVKEGLMQPFSAMGGLKADLIKKNYLTIFDFEYWFGSVYVKYLVSSDGFHQAASQCLKTNNEERIEKFAQSFRNLDYLMTLITEVALFKGFGKVLSSIIRVSRPAWSPVTRIIIPQLRKLRVPAIFTSVLLLDSTGHLLRQREQVSQNINNLLLPNNQWNQQSRREKHIQLLDEAFNHHTQFYNDTKSKLDSKKSYIKFTTYIQTHFSPQVMDKMKSDLKGLQEGQNPSSTPELDDYYHGLLVHFLPKIEKHLEAHTLGIANKGRQVPLVP